MKFTKNSLFFILFLFCFNIFAFSQEKPLKGLELCDNLYSILLKNNADPEKQYLLTQNDNTFSYNILIKNNIDDNHDTLFVVFTAEDAFSNQDILLQVIENLKTKAFNSCVLIAYGENSPVFISNSISGTKVFADSIADKENCYALIVNLSSRKNLFQTGTRGYSAPSWLIVNTFDAYSSQHLTENLPFYLLSQLSSFNFSNNRQLDSFLSLDIPAITAGFSLTSPSTTRESVLNVLDAFFVNFEEETEKINDYHFLMFNLFGHKIWISEYNIVRLIIILIFASLLFIFILSFVNINIQNLFWDEIKKIWYLIPATFILSTTGFFAGRGIYYLTSTPLSRLTSPFNSIIVQVNVSLLFVFIFFVLELLFHSNYTSRSIDFLFVISTFINQFLFSLIDISLFPIFLIINIISIAILFLKKQWQRLLILFLIQLPLITYVFRLYQFSDSSSLIFYIQRNNNIPFILSFVMLPSSIILFGILKGMSENVKKVYPAIVLTVLQIFVLSVCLILNAVLFSQKSDLIYSRPSTDTNDNNSLTINYKDRKVFTEIVRTVTIQTTGNPEYVTFTVSGVNENPVLYSDYNYNSDSNHNADFIIPYCPPQSLIFTYGTTDITSEIKVNAYYYDTDEKKYSYIQKKIYIEGSYE